MSQPEPPRTQPRSWISPRSIVVAMSTYPLYGNYKKFFRRTSCRCESMGFGSVLHMEVNHISTHLGFWFVRNFDEQFDELNVGNHRIKITFDVVYEVFGIPKGSKPVVTIVDKKIQKR
ncbi:hypothetical protein Hanom_Chr16g01445831 [Helianthus anomalus]